MLKKIFISAILLLAILCFVVSLLKGKNNSDPSGITVPDRVAIININGTIMSGMPEQEAIWQQSSGVTSGSIMQQLREAGEDKTVKVVLLNIDSGGGSATAAEEVSRELLRFKEQYRKPIVSAMGNTAASAAYWIAACASDRIYANSTTLTGSIGAYMPYMNMEELYKKIGVTSNKIKSGPYKDILANDRPMTAEEKKILQDIVDEIQDEFIKTVANGRKLDPYKVRQLADGRIYTGLQAQRLGLVDNLGNYYDALLACAELGNIKPGKDGLPPVKKQEKQQPWEYLLGAEIVNVLKAQLLKQVSADVTGLQGAGPVR